MKNRTRKQRRRRGSIKPRARTVEYNDKPSPGLVAAREIEEFSIKAWCPDTEAKAPPEQVHIILKLKRAVMAYILRFNSPDTLGWFIEELIWYRRTVFPDSEPVTGEIAPRPPERRPAILAAPKDAK